MNKKHFIFLFLAVLFLITSGCEAQENSFKIKLEPMSVNGLGGLQSYAYAQSEGKWLIVGGRLDGLHRRQPWASFDLAGHNDKIWVVDPQSQVQWSITPSYLSPDIQMQLRSTNMQFYQDGDLLYLVGGYGYSEAEGDHITFPSLIEIKVSQAIDAITNNLPITDYVRQITGEQFAVTGGKLLKLHDTYYLAGGHRFDGRYNPMGGPSFVQSYTNAVRKFNIYSDASSLVVQHLNSYEDQAELHRRDLNVVPHFFDNQEEGFMVFSGVFQEGADIPFLNCVEVDSSGYMARSDFSQYYNHYHCPVIPLYSENDQEMHTIFFGGIAQYYDNEGVLVQDDDIPFVNTIARVTRTNDGSLGEYKLPEEMPGLLGAGAEFIKQKDIPTYSNGIIRLDELSNDTTLVGYIYGGIVSSDRNIFWINDGTQSAASASIYKVYFINSQTTNNNIILNEQSNNSLRMQVFPNPNDGRINIDFYLDEPSNIEMLFTTPTGKRIARGSLAKEEVNAGRNRIVMDLEAITYDTVIFVTLQAESGATITQKVIINPE